MFLAIKEIRYSKLRYGFDRRYYVLDCVCRILCCQD